jgi:nicotinamidase-related amidase
MEDNARLCRFIYRNLAWITEIVSTIDTHEAVQIFHPVFWVNNNGEHPHPYTQISIEQVEKREWRANPKLAQSLGWQPSDLERHALYYLSALAGRYPLMIWPYHSILGGVGHALVAGVEEAIFFHALARATRARFETKGRNPLTENYSVLRPEVLNTYTGEPIGQKNTDLIERLLGYNALIVAGQAKSHCVVWTLNDLLLEIRKRNGLPIPLIYLLEDCMSPVVVPGADFTDAANAAFARFQAAGMHVIRSTDEVKDWPQFPQTRHVR